MAFITDENFTIMSKEKYAETQIPLWEQKLIAAEKKQRKLKARMLKELQSYIVYDRDELYNKSDVLYIYESCTSQGCFKCQKQIPYFWPALWAIYDYNVFNNENITNSLQQIGVVNRGYTMEQLHNYMFGCCSDECKKAVAKRCLECNRYFRPSESYSYERFCSNDCWQEFNYQCYRDDIRNRW